MDGPTDQWTNGRTKPLIVACPQLKIQRNCSLAVYDAVLLYCKSNSPKRWNLGINFIWNHIYLIAAILTYASRSASLLAGPSVDYGSPNSQFWGPSPKSFKKISWMSNYEIMPRYEMSFKQKNFQWYHFPALVCPSIHWEIIYPLVHAA